MIFREINRNKVEALFLDFDGTLIDYHEVEDRAIRDVLSRWGVGNVEKGVQFYRRINEALWEMFRQGKIISDDIRYRRFKELFDILGLNRNAIQSNEEYLESFILHSRVEEKVLEKLDQLKEQGFKLMVLTNGFHNTQKRRLKNCGILERVDGFITSEEVEKPKPAPYMFLQAMQNLSISPEQAVMVGDSYDADIKGALNLGIEAAYIGKEIPRGKLHPFGIFQNFKSFVDYWIG